MAIAGVILYSGNMADVKSKQSAVREDLPSFHEVDAAKDTFTLAHISDPHLSSPKGLRLREMLNKRALGYASWLLRRRAEHRNEVLSALLRDLAATRPDHIVVTGDLTRLGLPAEFRVAGQWLRTLGPPSQVSIIPGNHDAYVSAEWKRTFALWTDYMRSDTTGRGDDPGGNSRILFPTYRVRWKAALIGVSTAQPCGPLLAVGRIGGAQLERLERMLSDAGRQGLFRVVLIHHPPLPGVVAWRKRLTDGTAFRSVLARKGVELVLHGHRHSTSMRWFKTLAGRAMAIGVPSASALGATPERRARYHLYRLAQKVDGWDVFLSLRRYSKTENRFREEGEKPLRLARALK
jgi:3',5'-cyclic AMP phosphodiesterase CpdA